MVMQFGARTRQVFACFPLMMLVAACGDDPVQSSVAGGSAEFCDLMLGSPPTEAFRDPTDNIARQHLDEYLVRAEELAPDEIRADVVAYRHSVDEYLDALSEEPPPPSIDEAQRAQETAGDAVNDFVDDQCT